MGLLIQGVRVGDLDVVKDDKSGVYKVKGSYQLMSDKDVVVAKDSFNDSYGDKIKVESTEIQNAINDLVGAVKKSLEITLGFTKGGE